MDNPKKTYTITISEPWDFESPYGKNIIQGIILSIVNSCLIIFKANHILNFDGIIGNILVLSPRFKEADFENIPTKEVDVNGGVLLIEYNDQMKNDELKKNCKFVLIGTLNSQKQQY